MESHLTTKSYHASLVPLEYPERIRLGIIQVDAHRMRFVVVDYWFVLEVHALIIPNARTIQLHELKLIFL